MTQVPLTPRRLVTRITRSVAAPATVVGIIVLALAVLSAALPRVLDAVFTASIRYDIDSSNLVAQREFSGVTIGGPSAGGSLEPGSSGFSPEVDKVWGAQRSSLDYLHSSMPDALRAAVSRGQIATSFDQQAAGTLPGNPAGPKTLVSLGVDPYFTDRIVIDEGELPAPFAFGDATADMVLSHDSAEAAKWPIGEARLVGNLSLRLSGIFSVLDEHDPYWSHTTGLATHTTVVISGDQYVLVQPFLDPASFPAIDDSVDVPARSTVWFGIDSSALTAANAATVAVQARKFLSASHPLSVSTGGDLYVGQGDLHLTSRAPDFLDATLARTAVTQQSIAMLASGPLGALIAILVLASLLFVRRQAPTLHLLTARGATRWQLATISGLSSLVIALPAAIIGAVVGVVVAGAVAGIAVGSAGSVLPSGSDTVVPVVLALAAASLVAVLSLRPDRVPPGGPRVGRLVVELVVTALAAVSIIVLAQRAPSGADDGPAPFDPLLAAEPLLLVLVGGIVVLRLYPLVVRRLVAVTKRARGLIGFLGAAEASAQSAGRAAGGPVTALAVIIGVSIAVFSGSLLTTLRMGIDDSAESAVGSDLTVVSRVLTKDQSAAIAALPGVEASVTLYTSKDEELTVGASRESVHFIVVDTAALRAVQAGVAGAIELPDAVSRQVAEGDAVPIVMSQAAADELGDDELSAYGAELEVIGTVPGETALSSRTNWILIDAKNEDVVLDAYTTDDHMLVRFAPGVDGEAVASKAREIVGEYGTVSTPDQVSDVQRSSPAIVSLDTAVVVAILLSGIACAFAIIMTLGLGAAARQRLLGLLAALGLDRKQARALTAWEIAPIAITAVIAGTIIGVVLPFLVVAGTDLRPFTGGITQPGIVIDPLLTVTVVGAFCLVVVLAVALSTLAVRTTATSRAIRSTEEG